MEGCQNRGTTGEKCRSCHVLCPWTVAFEACKSSFWHVCADLGPGLRAFAGGAMENGCAVVS